AYLLRGKQPPTDADGVAAIAKELVDAGETAIHLPASPLMHGTGFITSTQSLTGAGTVVTLEGRKFDAHELWRAVEKEGVRQMAIVGDAFAKPMLRALEEAEAKGNPYDVSSVQLIISSGVMWTAEVKQALLERGSFILYDALSASEGIGFATNVTMPGSEVKTAKFSVGPNTKVFAEDGREIEPGSGEAGMLAVGGAIPLGYYKDEDKSAATFREFGGRRWSVPGDFASVEADGTVTLLGRGSACINTGGEKVYPEEVEEAVKTHPAVLDCNVVGVPDEKWGEAVTAVLSFHDGETAEDASLREAAAEHLADYKRPKHFVVVDEVVRGPSGKADYKWAKSVAEKELAGH
ncbi:MAG: AMP-binding protein, partial [Actinobacteria bacterium]|nr:AMP-binding protein [Actinomycetota bacterium]